MAESAVPDVSLSAGSEAVFDIVCQPCSSDGKNVEAEAYCRDCREHLCGQCIKHHKKFSSMKHHQLVDKDAMPGTQDDLQVRDVCTERCPDHGEEIVKFFCPDHDDLACGVCVTLSHKKCEDMDYIQDIAEDRVRDFMPEMEDEDLTQDFKDTVTLALENKQKSSDCHAKIMHDLDVYRDELVDVVDKNVQDMRDHAEQIFAQNTERMDKLAGLGNQAIAELQPIAVDFKNLMAKKFFCKLFVEIKRKEKTFMKLQEDFDKMGDTEVGVPSYIFEPDDELRATIGRRGGIGKLAETSGQIHAEHVADVNVKSTDNEETCSIRGVILISQYKAVVIDYNNDTIKLIDTINNSITSEITPEATPGDVTVCNDEVAVALPDASKIVFLKYDEGLVHDDEISVDGRCKGLDWYDDKLYVAFCDEQKVEVMTKAGIVLQTFSTNDKGKQLFYRPRYVTVNAANKRIYVSDTNKERLIELDMDGNRTGKYKDACPRQLAADRTGMMFLCDYLHDTVHLLSRYGEQMKILLNSDDDIVSPYSVCYCEQTRRLYVGMNSDTVKVYQIS